MPGIEDSLDHLAAAVHEIDDAPGGQVKGVRSSKAICCVSGTCSDA
jgi:hypothetical protein